MAQPGASTPTPLGYHCSECAAVLDDANSLFTSCGHFFCAAKKPGTKPCTKHVADTTGTCEQCGTVCNFGALKNRADGYNSHVRSHIFDDVATNLRSAAEILDVGVVFRLFRYMQFRTRHAVILKENVIALKAKIDQLQSTIFGQTAEISSLTNQNTALRDELNGARTNFREEKARTTLAAAHSSSADLRSQPSAMPSFAGDKGGGQIPSAAPPSRLVEPGARELRKRSRTDEEERGGRFEENESGPSPLSRNVISLGYQRQSRAQSIKTLLPERMKYQENEVMSPQRDVANPVSTSRQMETPQGVEYRADNQARKRVRANEFDGAGSERGIARARGTSQRNLPRRRESANALQAEVSRREIPIAPPSPPLRRYDRAQGIQPKQTRLARSDSQVSGRGTSTRSLGLAPSSLNQFARDNVRTLGARGQTSARRESRSTGLPSARSLAFRSPTGLIPRPSATPQQLARAVNRTRSIENPLGGTSRR